MILRRALRLRGKQRGVLSAFTSTLQRGLSGHLVRGAAGLLRFPLYPTGERQTPTTEALIGEVKVNERSWRRGGFPNEAKKRDMMFLVALTGLQSSQTFNRKDEEDAQRPCRLADPTSES